MRSRNVLFAALFWGIEGILVAPQGAAQPLSVEIGDEPSCSSCVISIDKVVELGEKDDEGMIWSRWALPFALREGKWASVEGHEPGTLRFYDPSGDYTHRFEAPGEGPGEFRAISDLLWVTNGYLVFDRRLGRLSRFSNDFEFIGTHSMPFVPLRLEGLSNGDLVFNAVSPASAARGHLVHVADTSGVLKASFGGDERPIDLRIGNHILSRILEPTADGTIWTSRRDRYELVAFSHSGDTLQVLTRNADWFEPDAGPQAPVDPLSRPPNPVVEDIVSDAEGLLWVLIHVPDRKWEDAIRSLEFSTDLPDWNQYLDSVIEVLDPMAGQLLARIRVPEALREVPGGEDEEGALLFQIVETEGGLFPVGILRATLHR